MEYVLALLCGVGGMWDALAMRIGLALLGVVVGLLCVESPARCEEESVVYRAGFRAAAVGSHAPRLQTASRPAGCCSGSTSVGAWRAGFPRYWRFGLQYFQGTANPLDQFIVGECELLTQNGVRLTAARRLTTNLFRWPVDLLAEASVLWHNEKRAQPNFFQFTLGFKVEWKRWPWSRCLRTRLGVATGLSYAEHIPMAEQLNRKGRTSRNLLHYLDLTLALNCADLCRLTRLDHVFFRGNASCMDHVWLTAGIPHRSGVRGLYGSDSTGRPIKSGSNYFSIGIEADF